MDKLTYKTNLLTWLKKKTYLKTEIDNLLTNKANNATATTSSNGLMSKEDKTKLNGIATGADKTTIDTSITSNGTNPVQGKAIYTELQKKAPLSHTHGLDDLKTVTDFEYYTHTGIKNTVGLSDITDNTNMHGIVIFKQNNYCLLNFGLYGDKSVFPKNTEVTITSSTLPERFRPPLNARIGLIQWNNSTARPGLITVNSNGHIIIRATSDNGINSIGQIMYPVANINI